MTRDAIVVGGGHNGLVAAAYLAQAGLDVLVLERRDVLGGAAVTEELWPGYRVSTAAYLVSLLQEKVVRDLDLPRYGYEILPKDPPYFSPRLDGQHFFMWRDMGKTLEEIARLSERDAERYPAYEEMLDRVTAFVEPLLLEPPPALPGRDEPEADGGLGALHGSASSGLPRQTLAEVMRIFTASVADLLDDWFESEALKAALATDGVIGAAAGPRTPGTAYVLLAPSDGAGGRLARALGLREGRDGRGLAGHRGAAARGRRRDPDRRGRRSCADPRRPGAGRRAGGRRGDRGQGRGLERRPEADVPGTGRARAPAGRRSAPRWTPGRSQGVSFKLNLALGELPSWQALPGHDARAAAQGHDARRAQHRLHRAGLGRREVRADLGRADDRGRHPDDLRSVAGAAGQADRLAVRAVRAVPPAPRAPGRRSGERFTDRVIATLGEYAPNLPGAIEHQLALAPPDLEARFGLTGGHIFHGELSPGQLFFGRPLVGWSRYATPIDGLYLCGSGTHPGGGVMGASGHNAAGGGAAPAPGPGDRQPGVTLPIV